MDVFSRTFLSAAAETGLATQTAASLALANHASGQVSDKFTTTSPVTDVLYRFNLARSGTVTISNLRVHFTTDGGVSNGDVTNGELWVDNNSDGAIDGGDTMIQGSVTPYGGVLTFTTNFTPGTSGTNYLVRATVSDLGVGDTTTFSLGTADIDEVEAGVVESGSITSGTHTQDSAGGTFEYRRSITIDYTKVDSSCGSSDLSNYPVLVSLSGTWLKTTGSGGQVDLSQLGLEASRIQNARYEETWSGGTYEEGACLITYRSAGKTVVTIWALRYRDEALAGNYYDQVQVWMNERCGVYTWANLGYSGMIHCQFSNAYDKIFWQDYWIVDILTLAGGKSTPDILVDQVRDALAAHWKELIGPSDSGK